MTTAASPSREPADRLVCLARRDRDTVTVTYRVEGGGEIGRPHTASLSEVRVLWSLAQSDTATDTQRVGSALFRLLFGADAAGDSQPWAEVFGGLFGRQSLLGRTPITRPVRLLIGTDDPELASLPWRLLRWQTYDLGAQGWLVSVSDPSRRDPEHLPVGARILFVGDGSDDSRSHAAELGSRLAQSRLTESLRVVQTQREVREQSHWAPEILYVFARDTHTAETLLHGAWSQGRLLVLNLLDPTDGASRLALSLRGDWRCVVVPLVASSPDDARRLGMGLLADLLDAPSAAARTPLVAVHRQSGDLRARTLQVMAGYSQWHTERAERRVFHGLARQKLDRIDAKGAMERSVKELANSLNDRFRSVLAWAEPGHDVRSLWHQLQRHLRDEQLNFGVKWRRVLLPRLGDSPEQIMLDHLRTEAQVGAGAGMREILEALAGASGRQVLILDWGTHGGGPPHPPAPKVAHVQKWLRVGREVIGPSVPPTLRVLSFLAVEAGAKGTATLNKVYLEQSGSGTGEVLRLPALELVDVDHVATLLGKRDLSSFLMVYPRERIREVAVDIVERSSGGVFEEAVALIERAEREGWATVFPWLESHPAPARPPLIGLDPDEVIE